MPEAAPFEPQDTSADRTVPADGEAVAPAPVLAPPAVAEPAAPAAYASPSLSATHPATPLEVPPPLPDEGVMSDASVGSPVPSSMLASPPPSLGNRLFIPAQSDSLQEQLERRRRTKQQQRDTLERTVARQTSFASLSQSLDGTTMSPAVSIDAVHSRGTGTPTRSPRLPSRGIRWFDDEEAPSMYLAVHRKRVGHLLVLPTRLVFQLTHSTIKPLRTPAGMTDLDAARLTKVVDGRVFYPLISLHGIREMIQAEMQGREMTPFEAYSVMASVMPEPNRAMFEAPLDRIVTVKRTRKNTPVIDQCAEGIEIVLSDSSKGLTLPAVFDRDRAFQRILALDPNKWPA